MAAKSNMFRNEADRIKTEHDAREAALTNAPAAQEAHEDLDKIIRVNISLTKGYHKKLIAYAKKRCLPASAIIRMWIDEHCD